MYSSHRRALPLKHLSRRYSQGSWPSFLIKTYLRSLKCAKRRVQVISLFFPRLSHNCSSGAPHFPCYPSFPSLYWHCLSYQCAYGRLNPPRDYHIRQDRHQRALYPEIWKILRRQMYGASMLNGLSSTVRLKVCGTHMRVYWTVLKRQYLVLSDLWPADNCS